MAAGRTWTLPPPPTVVSTLAPRGTSGARELPAVRVSGSAHGGQSCSKVGPGHSKPETRRPRTEDFEVRSPKAEGRNPKTETQGQARSELRPSDFRAADPDLPSTGRILKQPCGPLAEPASVPEPGALPSVAGLDTQDGLRRVAGNQKLYLKLLRQFIEQQGPAVGQITAALAQGDDTLAERLAHTLKGVAGNIGAKPVQAAAGNILGMALE